MTRTYPALQGAPPLAPHETQCRRALDASAAHLGRGAQHLACAAPDYHAALRATLYAIRHAYTALLAWHGHSPRPEAPLVELARPAEQLASMLRTCQDRACMLEDLEASLQRGAKATVTVREAVQTSYYTARNTLSVVLGELPERITGEAIWALNRAQAIRIGWTQTAHEPAQEAKPPVPTVRVVPRRPARTAAVA